MIKKIWGISTVVCLFLVILVSCNFLENRDNSNDDHIHSYGEWNTVIEPSCMSNGTKKRVCSCGFEEVISIDSLGGHDIIHHDAQEATCTECGWEAYYTCLRCDYTTYNKISALGHSLTSPVVENRIRETCTTDGSYDSVVYCSICNAEVARTTKVLKKRHDFSTEWTVDLEPTCGRYGSKSHHCTQCEEQTDVTVIPKTENHSVVIDEKIEPTHTTKGKTEGKHCSACGEILIAQQDIAAIWNGTIKEPSEIINKDGRYYYLINSAEEFAYLATADEKWDNSNYILNCNIFLNEKIEYDENGLLISNDGILSWGLIKSVNIFDGNNHFISGIYCKQQYNRRGIGGYAGVFASAGEIRNLSVRNSYLFGDYYVGGIASSVRTIDNCSFEGVVVGRANYLSHGVLSGATGGICGAGMYINNCTNYGIVKGNDGAGGITSGQSYDSISNCKNFGKISGNNYIGGIIGYSDGSSNKIDNCKNYGEIYGKDKVGGIVGGGSVYCVGNTNFSSISGITNVGGIIGYLRGGNCTDCTNNNEIKGTSSVGGIIGYCKGKICDSINLGNVLGQDDVGAVIGYGDIFADEYSIENSVYLKNDEINTEISGIGNLPDEPGIVVVSEIIE